MLTCLTPPSPLAENCICRVPKKLRQLNKAAYTPQMVFIGPLHHGEKHLKGMEKQKMRCLKSFLACETINLEDCVKMIKNWEKRIRNCYAESIKLSSDEFVKMILLDSSFIIVAMVESYLDYLLRSDLLTFSAAIQKFVYHQCLLDIQFNKGVLKIPHLRITDDTEQVLRNIIALEWYPHGQNSYIIDYIGFMENLIDIPEDAEILEKNGILEN
ncbi:hypothetical protein ACSBR2_040248 [Camellia fascicularis]